MQQLRQMRAGVRAMPPTETPAALRARILDALDAEDAANAVAARAAGTIKRLQPRSWWDSFWGGALSGVAASAIAAMMAFALLIPRATPLVDDLVGAHRHALQTARLIEVASSDHHTVKPWFAGHADVSPLVADFTADGFTLIGGRADTFQNQRAAVVVYRHGAHVIDVFTWARGRGSLPHDTTRFGFHMAFWQAGDLDYCAVSDTGWDELRSLVSLLQRQTEREIGSAARME